MRYRIDTERTDIFDINMIITMCVRLNEDVPYDKLSDAFGRACASHEVMRSKVIIEPSGDAFYVDNEHPHHGLCETDSSLSELIYENERKRFRIEDGEYVRAFKAPDGLVFMMHHMGGDGKSLLYLIETFMKVLEGEACEDVPFRSIALEDLPQRSRIPFFYEILTRSWNRRWQKEKRVFGFEDLDKAHNLFWKEHKTCTELISYGKDELEDMLKRAKEARVSLTSYLIADLIKDRREEADIGLAVDARPDRNRCMGNQATGISVRYRYDPRISFGDNAKAIQKAMRKKLSDDRYRYFILQFMGRLDPTLKDAMNLYRAGYYRSPLIRKISDLLGYGNKVKDYSITNLTRADITLDYGRYAVKDIIFIPPVVSYGKNIIGVITAGDVMNVVRHCYEKDH